MTKLNLALSLAIGWLAATTGIAADIGPPSQVTVDADVQPDHTTLHIALPQAGPGSDPPAALHRLVALPPDVTRCQAMLLAGEADQVTVSEINRLRGVPVVSLVVQQPLSDHLTIELRHDGQWSKQDRTTSRLRSPAFDTALAHTVLGLPAKRILAAPSSYVIITTGEYLGAANTLADWKRRKGLDVTVVTTATIGSTQEELKAWLQTAYDSWEIPPAYVLLLGDNDDVPSWNLGQNYTDHLYTCLDGDDWLPDLMIGRLPADNDLQAQTVIARTIQYEREPSLTDPGWFTRTLAVGGNYPATTCVATVRWCAQQLEAIGFAPATEVMYDPTDPSIPPIFNGVVPITNALNEGASMVLYRGWAHGPEGWEPPRFLVPNVAGVENGAMTPIIFSFVCYTAKFYADNPCLGEAFLHHGTPEDLQGAVAFYGNNESWSHTRYNDAMAIAFFEYVGDRAITDLGTWALASKLRFMDFFPGELYAADHGEESVEFYFYIYLLLGDPELNFWRAAPDSITVAHAPTVAPGTDLVRIQVSEADGTTPLADARVGVVKAGQLLGAASSDPAGMADIRLSGTLLAGDTLDITVTHPDRLPREFTLGVGDGSAAFLAVASTTTEDDDTPPSHGDGDGIANPGENLEVLVTLRNHGLARATGILGDLSLTGPAQIHTGQVGFPDALGSQDVTALAPFVIQVDSTAVDGALIQCLISATHDGGVIDKSRWEFSVNAPSLLGESVDIQPGGLLTPGADHTLALTLRNAGSRATAGGSLTLALATPGVGTVTDATAVFGPLAPGSVIDTGGDTFGLQLAPDIPIGTGVTCRLSIVTEEGFQQETSLAMVVGQVDIGAPVGPDRYGYYAIDSIDIDYPALRPEYHWRELSPTYGGTGTAVEFPTDFEVQVVDLPFPFQFYGQSFNRLRVSDNGYVSFDLTGENDFYNWPIPTTFGDHSIVAPFWDNFHPDPEDVERPRPDGVFILHDPAAGTFTVEWSRVSHYQVELDDRQTFQVVLYDPSRHTTATGDGEILFLYKQVSNVDYLRQYATVGIESPGENDGLQLTYANIYNPGTAPVSSGLAVKITTQRPQYDPLQLASFEALPTTGGMRLEWVPRDDRPVIGWRIYRIAGENSIALTDQPLPATAREYLDRGMSPDGECVYRLVALHPHGLETELGSFVAPTENVLLNQFSLRPCWPNPVKDTTHIGFAIPREGPAKLRIYDVAGRLVRTLLDGPVTHGENFLVWDGRDEIGRAVAGGVYFYRLEADGEVRTRKLLLVR